MPDTAPPQISNISVSSLSSSSATISWTTDEPSTSQINYGFSSGYGQSSPLNSNLTTNHSVTLTGLSESSGYHFQVRSLDDSGNPGASSDNTFLTLADGAVSSGGGNTGGNSGIESPPKTKIPLKIQPSENVPPVVTLTTSFDKSFSSTPKISGKATDNDVLAGIEYSVDGGQNWLPVDSEQGLGSSKATFDFTPLNLEDGNYQVLARAIDTSSNIGYSAVHVLVVDRLPPIAGASVLSLGPQVMNPDENGVIYSLAGIDQKLTLSAVGGPTDMKILAKTSKGKVLESFTLTQMPDTGLWSGLVSFKKPGAYRLVVEALDGAGNKTSRVLNYVYAAPQPQTTYSTTGEPVNAQIEVYYLEPESRSWNLWEGASYGQDNPQNTDPLGNFKLFLPQGKYYIKASAKGYKQLTSDIFEIDHAKPFSATLGMEKNYTLDIGRFELSLPIWNTSKINTDFDNLLPANFGQSTLVDKQLPDFSLKDSKGQQIGPISFLGRPTLLSVMTTWSPDASRQIEALAALQTNGDINIVPIALQEKTGKTTSFTAISGQELSWLVDPDSTFSSVLKSGSVPTHYFVDRRGEVKAVLYGFLDKQTIQAHLGGL